MSTSTLSALIATGLFMTASQLNVLAEENAVQELRDVNAAYHEEITTEEAKLQGDPSHPRPSEQELNQLTEQLLQALPQVMGFDPQSREGKKLAAAIAGKADVEASSEPQKDIQHVYKFSEGKVFPTQETLSNNARRESEILKQYMMPIAEQKQIAEQEFKRQEQLLKEYGTPRKLERCSSDDTVSNPLPAGQGESSFGIKDFLFIEKTFAVDPAKAFGVNAFTVLYSDQEGDILSAVYGRIGIPCLPYRMRSVDNMLYFHTGEPALRNYESDPHGRGVLDATVKEQLSREQQ